ncbi:hypothetical protein AVEN_144067-1 [Araneus ventricosus]|uniref:Uncharacterized protein n=1 Tax=Araneus ventricosus TaxID=182803 RepID=A0A4Y2DGM0_ARAVE|nr:hypothetical protein AVEN_144067-1 [Araneus ventricosus]
MRIELLCLQSLSWKEVFGNPMSFVFQLVHSIIKLKCDPEERERCSHKNENHPWGGPVGSGSQSGAGGPVLKEGGRGDGDRNNQWFGATINDPPKWMG